MLTLPSVSVFRYHFNSINPKNSTPLGDGMLKLKDLLSISPKMLRVIKLINPTNGKPSGEVITAMDTATI